MKKHSEPKDNQHPATGSHIKSLRFEERELVSSPVDNDEEALSKAKVSWLFGEWNDLIEMDQGVLMNHPVRDKLALLKASAHQQLGCHNEARKFTRMALDWGCSPRVVAQIMIAGVHNTLGRIAALKQDEDRIDSHFAKAVDVIAEGGRTELVSHARAVREMTKMGLLPQAAGLVDKELKATESGAQRPEVGRAKIHVLQTELELLHHELSLAQQRQQIFQPQTARLSDQSDSESSEWRDDLQKKSVSQLGQDLWVLERTSYKRSGFFVEFGATDGVLLSNTFLLEKEFGWQGICAEPNPKFQIQLKNNRNCIVSDQCIAGESGKKVEFIFADAYGGMKQYADDDQHREKREAYRVSGEVATLTTVSLHDFLRQHGAPCEIDYLSIDTEGSEYEILAAFPFDTWKIQLITVEHNFTKRRADIRTLLEKNGYRCVEMQWDDWYELTESTR